MGISDKLAREAIQKIRSQEEDIARLRQRLGIEPSLGAAIQKSLENPAVGQPRNKIVSGVVRAGIFKGEKPVAKAAVIEADKRKKIRRELQKAGGLRVKDDDK